MKNNNLSENYEEDIFTDENEELEQENGMFEHFRFEVDKGQALLRIDKYLTAHLEGTSRHRVQQAIDAEYVRVNGNLVKANYKIKPCDLITIHLPYRRRGLEIKPEKMDLDIRYEDDDLMVINKPAGLVVHPGHGNYTGTLLNGLSYYLGISQGPDAKDERMGVLVHRIDKDTSGTLLIAKNEDAQLFLAKQFFVHSIERKYIAIVNGVIKHDTGTIDAPIGRDKNNRNLKIDVNFLEANYIIENISNIEDTTLDCECSVYYYCYSFKWTCIPLSNNKSINCVFIWILSIVYKGRICYCRACFD